MKTIAYALLLIGLMTTGCARMREMNPSASPATPNASSDKGSCEASGGKWNTNTRICDR